MSLSATVKSLGRYCLKTPQAGPPLRACITITDRCNLRCASCSVWKREVEDATELTLEEMRSIIDQTVRMGVRVFYIFGGEPLIRKEFFDIVGYISRDQGLFSETVTNGVLITPETAEEIVKVGLNKIWVSIDGPPDVHDKLRGVPGTFKRAAAGLKNMLEAKKRHNSPILIDLAVTISSLNYRYFLDLIKYFQEMDLYEINVRHMGVFFEEDIRNLNETIGRELNIELKPGELCFSAGESIVLNQEEAREFKDVLGAAQSKCVEYGIPLHIEPDLLTTFDWRKGKNISNCLHLWTQININAQGSVIPCLWYDLLPVGNIRQSSLEEIWNNEHYRNIRKNIGRVSACSKCCYFYLSLPQNAKRALQVANFPFKTLLTK